MVRFSCGVNFIRIAMFVLNVLFVVFGFALFGFGIYLKVSKKFDVALSEHINAKVIGGDAIEAVGVILIVVGLFTVLLSTFGCLGALLKNKIHLYIYTVILGILMIMELAAFIALMSSRVSVRDSYETGLRKVFNNAYDNNQTDLMVAIENLELEFKCCGVHNYTDYTRGNYTIPLSCRENQSLDKSPFTQGCADAIIDWIWDELPVIGGVLGAILFLEIFGLISSYCNDCGHFPLFIWQTL